MNNTRRKQIAAIMAKLEELKEEVEALHDEEQECFDNLPEGIQYSERGEAMEAAADNLDSAFSSIEEALEYLEEASV